MSAIEHALDIGAMPDLIAVAEEVARTGVPRLLRCAGREVALIVPTPRRRPRHKRTAEDFEAFQAAAGSWADIDTDALVATIREDRGRSAARLTGI